LINSTKNRQNLHFGIQKSLNSSFVNPLLNSRISRKKGKSFIQANSKDLRKTKNWCDKMKKYELLRREEIEYLSYEALKKEQKICSFTPSLNTSSLDNKEFRTADEFYEDQLKYTSKTKEKVKILKQDLNLSLNKECEFKPNIDKLSARMAKRDQNVYDWLYSTSEHNNSTKHENNKELNFSFHPEINNSSKLIQRNASADIILYNDSKKRANKLYQKRQSINNSFDKSMKNASFVLQKSDNVIIDKFSMEFNKVFDKISRGLDRISYLKTAELLVQLKFLNDFETSINNSIQHIRIVSKNIQKQPKNEGSILYDLWNLLKGEDFGGLSRRTLKVFLYGVMGFYQKWMENPKKISENENAYPQPKEISLISEENEENSPHKYQENSKWIQYFPGQINEFCLKKHQANEIHNEFMILYQNRMSKLRCAKSVEKRKSIIQKKKTEFSFRPSINKNTKNLAKGYVERSINKMCEIFDKPIFAKEIKNTDLMYFKAAEFQNRRSERISKIKASEEKNLTFAPKINNYPLTTKNANKNGICEIKKYMKFPEEKQKFDDKTRNSVPSHESTAQTDKFSNNNYSIPKKMKENNPRKSSNSLKKMLILKEVF